MTATDPLSGPPLEGPSCCPPGHTRNFCWAQGPQIWLPSPQLDTQELYLHSIALRICQSSVGSSGRQQQVGVLAGVGVLAVAESQGQCWPLDDPQHQLQTQGGGSLLLSLGPVAQSLGHPPPTFGASPRSPISGWRRQGCKLAPKGLGSMAVCPQPLNIPVSTALELTRQGSLAGVGAPVDRCVPALGGKLGPCPLYS